MNRVEMEWQVIFGVLLDHEIYETHLDFFEKYSFQNDFFGKLAETIGELYGNGGDYDIIDVLDSFVSKFGADRCKLKAAFAMGMESVTSIIGVERCMVELLEIETPEGHTSGADENC